MSEKTKNFECLCGAYKMAGDGTVPKEVVECLACGEFICTLFCAVALENCRKEPVYVCEGCRESMISVGDIGKVVANIKLQRDQAVAEAKRLRAELGPRALA